MSYTSIIFQYVTKSGLQPCYYFSLNRFDPLLTPRLLLSLLAYHWL